MTTEERLDRIEHITVGLAEERRKDREEHRQLWRETQRQLNELVGRVNELTVKLADANDAITRLAKNPEPATSGCRRASIPSSRLSGNSFRRCQNR